LKKKERITQQSWDTNSMEEKGPEFHPDFPASTCPWGRAFLSGQDKIKAKGNNALHKTWQKALIKAVPLTK